MESYDVKKALSELYAPKAAFIGTVAVAPLEGLWTADDLSAFTERRKSDWDWTMMIRRPEWVNREMVAEATEAARGKGLRRLEHIRFEEYAEGLSV